MTIAVPLLLFIIGVALAGGRRSPPFAIALIFLLVGVWLGQTVVGKEIIAGFNNLARLIG